MNQIVDPTVSAVMIFLDEERFIGEAIESVLSQTLESWELLLVDDGSTDSSTDIARDYAGRHPTRIRYLEHEGHANRGMSASRALGVNEASGEYIAFLDADDVWVSHKLAKQVDLLRANPEAAMVCGPLELWYDWTGKEEDQKRDSMYLHRTYEQHPFRCRVAQPPQLLALFLEDEDLIPAAVLVRRDAVLRSGGPEEAFRGSFEDAVLWVKVCLNENVFVDDECLYKYRIHPDSWERSMNDSLAQRHAKFLPYQRWVEAHLGQQPHVGDALRRVLRKQRWSASHPLVYGLFDRFGKRSMWKQAVKALGRRVMPRAVYNWLIDRWSAARGPLLSDERPGR